MLRTTEVIETKSIVGNFAWLCTAFLDAMLVSCSSCILNISRSNDDILCFMQKHRFFRVTAVSFWCLWSKGMSFKWGIQIIKFELLASICYLPPYTYFYSILYHFSILWTHNSLTRLPQHMHLLPLFVLKPAKKQANTTNLFSNQAISPSFKWSDDNETPTRNTKIWTILCQPTHYNKDIW